MVLENADTFNNNNNNNNRISIAPYGRNFRGAIYICLFASSVKHYVAINCLSHFVQRCILVQSERGDHTQLQYSV